MWTDRVKMEEWGLGAANLGKKMRANVRRGGGRGERAYRHGKQRCKCRECRGEGEAAREEKRGREEPETQGREKRARTTQPRMKCPHNRQKNNCKDCGGASICEHNRRRSRCKDCGVGGTSICEHNRVRSFLPFCYECTKISRIRRITGSSYRSARFSCIHSTMVKTTLSQKSLRS